MRHLRRAQQRLRRSGEDTVRIAGILELIPSAFYIDGAPAIRRVAVADSPPPVNINVVPMAADTIDTVAREVRTSDAVVLIGAGASFSAGMPLAGQLSPLVWHALDSNLSLLRRFCVELGVPFAAAKSIVLDDPSRLKRASEYIKNDEVAYGTFKKAFCELNQARARNPSPAHTALARLVHSRRATEVVSFNWDTLVESAFLNRFGFGINSQEIILETARRLF